MRAASNRALDPGPGSRTMTHARQVIASPHFRVIFAVLATLSWVLGSAAAASAATAPSAGDWPTYLHDPGRTAASTDSTLSPSNAAQLTRAWSFATGGVIAASSSVQGGTVYVGSWDGNEYAIDAATGTQKWKTFLGITTGNPPCDPPQAGVTSTATAGVAATGVAFFGGASTFSLARAAAIDGSGGSPHSAIALRVPAGSSLALAQTSFRFDGSVLGAKYLFTHSGDSRGPSISSRRNSGDSA